MTIIARKPREEANSARKLARTLTDKANHLLRIAKALHEEADSLTLEADLLEGKYALDTEPPKQS